jgi:uridine kinase
MNRTSLIEHISGERRIASHPLVVGVSGFGGSGKSTLARGLVEALPGAVRMRGDDFLDPARSHKRSADWDGVERKRLVSEVLTPVRSRQPEHRHQSVVRRRPRHRCKARHGQRPARGP